MWDAQYRQQRDGGELADYLPSDDSHGSRWSGSTHSPQSERASGKRVAEYKYLQPDGEPYLLVEKWVTDDGEKNFPQKHWTDRGWAPGAPDGPKIPYRLPELLQANRREPLFICEGEKDADSVRALGLTATTNSGGATKWTPDLNPWLLGFKHVYILADNDDIGREHAAMVAANLGNVVEDVRIVALPDLPPTGDVSDWISGGGTGEALLQIAAVAPAYERKPVGLAFVDIAAWDTTLAPPQEWLVEDLIPYRDVALFSGKGGYGKSILAMQLMMSAAHGDAWLGKSVREGPAVYLNCEDDVGVLQRRFENIAKLNNVHFADLKDRLHILAYAGIDAVLAETSKANSIKLTEFFDRLCAAVVAIQPVLIVIDNLADVYAGNEIVRPQVRQFITRLRGLAMAANATVILIAHPSRAGIEDDSGLSGSTAWFNSVRAQMHLSGVKPTKDGPPVDADLRELSFKKNNYGPLATKMVLRWTDGTFQLDDGTKSRRAQATVNHKAERLFLGMLIDCNQRGEVVSGKAGRNYAPNIFAKRDDAEGVTKGAFTGAMERLFQTDKIERRTTDEPRESHRKEKLWALVTVEELEGQEDDDDEPF